MSKNDGLVYAKGKNGHYRYMSKRELNKKNRTLSFFTVLFYILAAFVVLGAGYFLYTDYIRPFIESRL